MENLIFCAVRTEIIWTCNSNLNLNFKLTWYEIDFLNFHIYILLNYHYSGSPQRRLAESSSFYFIRWQLMLLICLKRPYCNVLDLLEPNNKALDSNSYYTLSPCLRDRRYIYKHWMVSCRINVRRWWMWRGNKYVKMWHSVINFISQSRKQRFFNKSLHLQNKSLNQ